MRRRDFLKAIGGSAAVWPFSAVAQAAMPVVGFLNFASPASYKTQLAAFLKGLHEAGYIEGQNVAIEYRWAERQTDRLPRLAADLVRRQVVVIAATSTPAAIAAKAATTSIPIVFETGGDPISLGLVASLNRPDGNVTGVTQGNVAIAPKRLQLLHELLPSATLVTLLVSTTDPSSGEANVREVQAAASSIGLKLQVFKANSDDEIEAVFAKLNHVQASGLIVGGGPFFVSKVERLAALAARYAVPVIYEFREFAAAGGLMSYGSEIAEAYRLAGVYVGRILKGEKPSELPVQQATKVELIVNLKSAKALNLTVPLPLLGRADEVIE